MFERNADKIQRLKKARVFDGAMGTLLAEKFGAAPPETLIYTGAEYIKEIHANYLKAGADIISANTFAAARPGADLSAVKFAVQTAREAVCEAGRGLVALDLGPTGRQLPPIGDYPFESAYQDYRAAVRAGAEAGADLILLETFGSLYELKAGVCAAKHCSDLPIIATMTFDTSGHTLCGAGIGAMVSVLEGLGVFALGINCGLGPLQAKELFLRLREITRLPVLIQPNAGLPEIVNGKAVYNCSPAEFAAAFLDMAKAGAAYLGGCCGAGFEHIQKTAAALKGAPFILPAAPENKITATGYSACIEYKGAESLYIPPADCDTDGLIEEAFAAADERKIMLLDFTGRTGLAEAVREIQSVVNAPLALKSGNITELAAAVKIYNGSPLICAAAGNIAQAKVIAEEWGGRVILY